MTLFLLLLEELIPVFSSLSSVTLFLLLLEELIPVFSSCIAEKGYFLEAEKVSVRATAHSAGGRIGPTRLRYAAPFLDGGGGCFKTCP